MASCPTSGGIYVGMYVNMSVYIIRKLYNCISVIKVLEIIKNYLQK